tara:strand:+ start:209 stop:601 length:393 start_codon:yes stop_codon:yes gene_type:complete
MSQSTLITIVLAVIIIAIFLVDYLKKRKEDALEKSVEKFVEKESDKKKSSGVLNWILYRKKNFSISIILILFFKLLVNHFFFPPLREIYTSSLFGYHIKKIFILELWVFLPVTIVFLIVVWFFNDKIKAQ